jgi:DNA polymerase IV
MNPEKRARSILHLDMDTFFCSVERLLDPSLEGKPVIVGGDPDSRGVVSAASYEAREFGVYSAMPLVKAARLCRGAVFLHGNFNAYLHYSRLIREVLGDYTPLVQPAGIDEAYLDLTGCRLALGEPAEVAGEIRQRIREELGLPSSAGLSTAKVVSKVASALSKPDGFIEVPPGGEIDFLAPLPVEKLPGVGPVCRGVLEDMGIRKVGELTLLPVEALQSVLGSWGRVLHEHARGVDRRRVAGERLPGSVSRERTYETDTIDYELVRSTLLMLCEKCCRALREDGLATSRVAVKLRYSDFNTCMKFHSMDVPTDQEQVVYRVVLDLFERLLDRNVRIRLVGIALSNLVAAGCQGELFGDPGTDSLRADNLNRSLDLIRDRYGFSAVMRGSTTGLTGGRPGGRASS